MLTHVRVIFQALFFGYCRPRTKTLDFSLIQLFLWDVGLFFFVPSLLFSGTIELELLLQRSLHQSFSTLSYWMVLYRNLLTSPSSKISLPPWVSRQDTLIFSDRQLTISARLSVQVFSTYIKIIVLFLKILTCNVLLYMWFKYFCFT